ncbi:carbamoyltransferase [Actinomadura sp. SCN-SB]|uniref:carbamoyltransferase family protein n=1 Tax=Actinomadura sp. SCN-SB TaxID=3373092 RepID=UPI003752CAAB
MMRNRHGASDASPVVLGLCSGTHDSAAALITGDRLIGLVEEERLNGIKHTSAYPQQAIGWLLSRGGVTPEEVTHVAYNFDPRRYLAAAPAALRHLASPVTARRALPRARSFARVYRNGRDRFRSFRAQFLNASVTGIEHHLAHGLYAATAGLGGLDLQVRDAAVLVVDSLGETATTTISHVRRTRRDGLRYQRVLTVTDPASLGYVYGAVTRHLGWCRGDEEGTVMALAAQGDPARFRGLCTKAIPLTDNGFGLDMRLFPLRVLSGRWPRVTDAFTAATCPPRTPGTPIEQIHMDLAAALQERTEQVMVHLARRARALTGASSLAVGGGVGMNCVAVGRICQEAGFDQVAVPPAPGDSGTAAGAALALNQTLTGHIPEGTGTCYLGPEYPELPLSPRPRSHLTATRVAAPAAFLARRLAEGQIVGLFQGRLETGPRALGNRSILASPLEADVVDRLNSTVKFREPFRPFAPVVLADYAADYFSLNQPSPFMSIASGVTDMARQLIPAVVHVNGTARVQTVTSAQNPLLAQVLAAFAQLTGHPVLINTSLNIKGKPICGTPDAALDCLTASGLDGLLLEGWWVTKDPSREASSRSKQATSRPGASS